VSSPMTPSFLPWTALIAEGILVDHDLQPGGRATGIQSSYRPAAWLAGTSAPNHRQVSGELIRLRIQPVPSLPTVIPNGRIGSVSCCRR
jgi:hypothetical protein